MNNYQVLPRNNNEIETMDMLSDRTSNYSSAKNDRNGVRRETYKLALMAIEAHEILRRAHRYELASQFLRSGTAPGALVAEYFYAESDRDSRHKLAIALKEANEFKYWTCLLRDMQYLPGHLTHSLLQRVDTVLSSLKFFHTKHQ